MTLLREHKRLTVQLWSFVSLFSIAVAVAIVSQFLATPVYPYTGFLPLAIILGGMAYLVFAFFTADLRGV